MLFFRRYLTYFLLTGIFLLAGLAWGQAGGDPLAILVQQVGKLKGEARLEAISDLGRTGDARALQSLFAVLRDTDPSARAVALQSLRWIRHPQVVLVLAGALQRETDAHARAQAVETLNVIADDASGWLKPADALPLLLAAARDTDPAVRADAIDGLAKSSDPRGAQAVLDAVTDKDADVRARVALALAALHPAGAVARVQGLLPDSPPVVRVAVAAALGQLHDAQAVDTLCTLTRDPDAHVRAATVRALWYATTEPALQAVTAELDDAKAEVRAAAVGTLSQQQHAAAKEALLTALQDKDALVRGAAASALGHRRDAGDVVPLLDALRSQNNWQGPAGYDCSELVTQALVEIGTPGVPALLAALRDDKVSVRRHLATALGQIGDMRAVLPLIALLDPAATQDDDPKVRQYAAHALGALGDGRAVAPLIKALRDRMPTVRWEIVDALAALQDTAANDALIAEMEKDDAEAGTHAAWALGVINAGKDGAALVALAKAMQNTDGAKQLAVIWALGQIGDPRAAPYLRLCLPEIDPLTKATTAKEKRIAAMQALGRLGDKDSAATLAGLVKDEVDPEIRTAAIDALGGIKDRTSSATLRTVLADSLPTLRWRALWALGEIGDTGAAGSLLEVLRDPQRDPADRALAAQALGKMQYTGAEETLLIASHEDVMQVSLAALGAVGNLPVDVAGTARLLEQLRDTRPAMRALAAGLLGQRKEKSAIETLGALLHDDDPAVRLAAMTALGHIGGERSIALLLPCVTGMDAGAALPALADTGDARAAAPLLDALKVETNGTARAQLFHALSKLPLPKETATLQPLLDALAGDDWRTRAAAAETLGAWHAPTAAAKLLPLLHDDTAAVRIAAYAALRAISGKDFAGDTVAWQQWVDGK